MSEGRGERVREGERGNEGEKERENSIHLYRKDDTPVTLS